MQNIYLYLKHLQKVLQNLTLRVAFLRANRRAVANIQFSREFVEAKQKMWEADTTKGFLVEKVVVYTKK